MPIVIDLNNIKPIKLEELEDQQPTDKPIDIKEKIHSKKKTKKIIKNKIISNQETQLLLTLKEAEAISGISAITIRKAIKNKEINYTLHNGKYKIEFINLLKWCYSSTRRKNVFCTIGIGKYVNSWNDIIK
ncbi:MAG TPA: hypothetical protein PKN97_02310 [bacterium]|nr:hypothetical protein [bacterium]